jgi:hypothetical protein
MENSHIIRTLQVLVIFFVAISQYKDKDNNIVTLSCDGSKQAPN